MGSRSAARSEPGTWTGILVAWADTSRTRQQGLAAAWLGIGVAAELTFLVAGAGLGLVAAVMALSALLIVGFMRPNTRDGRAALALAGLPLMRMLGLSMPTVLWPSWIWLAETGAGIILGVTMAARVLRLTIADLGLRRAPTRTLLAAAIIGLTLGLSLAVISDNRFVLPDRSPSTYLFASVAIVGGAFAEEILLRGLIQRIAGEVALRGAVAVSSTLTGLVYLSMDLRYMVVMVLFAVVYGSITRRTGSLAPAITCHGALLWSQLVLWPFVLAA